MLSLLHRLAPIAAPLLPTRRAQKPGLLSVCVAGGWVVVVVAAGVVATEPLPV